MTEIIQDIDIIYGVCVRSMRCDCNIPEVIVGKAIYDGRIAMCLIEKFNSGRYVS